MRSRSLACYIQDPFFSRRRWPSSFYGRLGATLSLGPSLTTSLMISLIWLNAVWIATRNDRKLSKYLLKLAVFAFLPVYIIVDVMGTLAWVNAHGGESGGTWITINSFILGFTQLAIGLLFVLYGVKVLRV